MYKLQVLKQKDIFAGKFDDIIVDFDNRNMKDILESANAQFPEEIRRKGFENIPTIVVALDV
ncbi:MAG: hypothetical protein Q7U87_03085, partial [bacterium]|nr:hypothetical protein [bacterium]